MVRKIGVVLFYASWLASMIAIGFQYDSNALGYTLLGQLGLIGLVLLKVTEKETAAQNHDSCDGCVHNLGGDQCRMNLEYECREGGGFEMWEEDERDA